MMHNDIVASVWLMKGITGTTAGTLECRSGRIKLTVDQLQMFDAALSDIGEVSFPWHYFGGGMKLTVRGERYRISFVEPGEYGDIGEGRRVGKIVRSIIDRTSGF